jgi:hypothetical protein
MCRLDLRWQRTRRFQGPQGLLVCVLGVLSPKAASLLGAARGCESSAAQDGAAVPRTSRSVWPLLSLRVGASKLGANGASLRSVLFALSVSSRFVRALSLSVRFSCSRDLFSALSLALSERCSLSVFGADSPRRRVVRSGGITRGRSFENEEYRCAPARCFVFPQARQPLRLSCRSAGAQNPTIQGRSERGASESVRIGATACVPCVLCVPCVACVLCVRTQKQCVCSDLCCSVSAARGGQAHRSTSRRQTHRNVYKTPRNTEKRRL